LPSKDMRVARRAALALFAVALGGCHHPQLRPEPEPVQAVRAHDRPTVGGIYHPVAAGETLARIARAYGTTPEALAEASAISDPRELPAGMKLFVPGATRVLPLPDLASDGALVDAASAGDPRPHHAPGCTGAHCLEWPLRGVIYARFGPRAGEQANGIHEGLDLAAPEGTPIAAADDGVVLYAGEQQGYGTLVILQHPRGLVTLYAHNRENLVTDGQRVRRGQIIARVGQSGRTSGPHCHFEVRRGEKPIDPLSLLPAPSSELP
jgi:lipoprotein NlpD